MKKTGIQKLAGALRVSVLIVFAVNILIMPLIPGLMMQLVGGGPEGLMNFIWAAVTDGWRIWQFFSFCFWAVWLDLYSALMTVFFWLCGICTAVILWQAKKVLDTVLAGDPFQMGNAKALNRAAAACWGISAAALVRLGLWLWLTRNPVSLFTYNTLFIPAFLMAGLLFQVMSALFRQAAELKKDQDLTI